MVNPQKYGQSLEIWLIPINPYRKMINPYRNMINPYRNTINPDKI